MRKKGPCFHCGIDSTPLWRNGPPGKPVLCNACGSRYRLGKALENYTPKTRPTLKVQRGTPIPQIIAPNEATRKIEENVSSNINYSAGSADYQSNNSSLESATSCLESCIQEDENENSGSKQTTLLESHVPSRKRSLVAYHSLSPIEQLQRDLYNILKQQSPSILSESPEDVLIYNVKNNFIDSTEIGLGSILLKPPATSTEQETEKCSTRTNTSAGQLKIYSPSEVSAPASRKQRSE